jgi:hypothetical protein
MERSKVMSDSSGVTTQSNAYFTLYDFYQSSIPPAGDGTLGSWDNLTGGDMTVSQIAYKIVSEEGIAGVKYLPGMTTYSPVQLLRSADFGTGEMVDKFKMISNLNLNVRGNYSVVMYDGNKPHKPVIMWNLINAIPTKVDGFSFNEHTGENYTTYEITLQPEYIEIVFP